MRWIVLCTAMLSSGCFWGDEVNWATQEDVMKAAKRCGVDRVLAGEAGSGRALAIEVPADIPDAKRKKDCIYDDLKRQDLMATRIG